jgi:hypothetical protein
MRKTKYDKFREGINMDSQLSELKSLFAQTADKRAKNACHKLRDILMLGYCVFALKKPSLLNFEQKTTAEISNLKQIYGIESICSDSTLREVLDTVNPNFLRTHLGTKFQTLEQAGILRDYAFKIGAESYLIMSCDGTQHFSSKKIQCECCCAKEHTNGTTTYHHNLLCATLVHPQKREVFVADIEPIVRQDGTNKQDCELNAAKRLQDNFNKQYADLSLKHNILFVEDALFSNIPHIEQLQKNGYSYILNVKPEGHKSLFAYIEGKRTRGDLSTHRVVEKRGKKTMQYDFEFINNVRLVAYDTPLRVNFIQCKQTIFNDKDEIIQVTTFSWVTNIKLTRHAVYAVMQAGRARWKVENETFNTLKNLGYHFEHNFGHGSDHLSTMFAYLMLTAFFTDQLVQYCCHNFQVLEQKMTSKIKLWHAISALFTTNLFSTIHNIYETIAKLYAFELTPNSS